MIPDIDNKSALILSLFEGSYAVIDDSDVRYINLGNALHSLAYTRPNITFRNTNIDIIEAFGNSTTYLLQYSNVSQYYGYTNSILYNQSTANIGSYTLVENAKIISI
ncbi:MAG: hypothetical protein ACTSRG_26065 [Candidatus Helarchaeota archaeon]